MKKHFNPLVTKFLLFAPVMGILLPAFSKMSLAEAVVTAVISVPVVYVLADLLVLPRNGTWAAISVDALATVLITWEASSFLHGQVPAPLGTVLVAATIATGEWYFHEYLMRTLFKKGGRG
ncbi:DUF2512 family protein [Desulfotomaculum copahuensis]|uniref:DUF2512 domain-containing protein n=1 Tax=Desulfotomaculum copahuensis TaxID=1838280 RepID=A0A1B7LC58_9FIRM|nr:DUF2512 family protein [Desulfotomaculum copahuensis]OAT80259.1 hypothetical protein A6M21_13980 [Desulfotomaculum copahuensis]